MADSIQNLTCPGCGAGVSTITDVCEYCKRPVVISSFNSVYDMDLPTTNKYAKSYKTMLRDNPDSNEVGTAMGMCYLKLGLYDKALDSFENAMEDNFDNPETFFYAAVATLGGKKPFVAGRANVDKALEYINAACMIEPRGVFYLFEAYLKYDFYERKSLNISPNYLAVLNTARQNQYSTADSTMLFDIIGDVNPF